MALNELDEVHSIYYYPTLRFYPRDSKHRPYNYDAGLSIDEVIQFVKRVTSVSLVFEGYEDENNESS